MRPSIGSVFFGRVEILSSMSWRTPFLTIEKLYLDLAFYKNPEYSGENEYRFAFLVDQKEPGLYRLNIGDIRDIATSAKDG